MSPNLKPLFLPQLVEERRQRESREMELATYYSHNSSTSDIPSVPTTPTFSTRGHARHPSSTSSIDSTYHSSLADSPSSPVFFTARPGKRSLPDVKEEPVDDRDERDDFEDDDIYGCFCDDYNCLHREPSVPRSSIQLSTRNEFEYDLDYEFFSDPEVSSVRPKKPRGESPIGGLATRIGTRFPSFSRKLHVRKPESPPFPLPDGPLDMTPSGPPSNRSSSVFSRQAANRSFEYPFPPTPTMSISESREDVSTPATLDILKANATLEREENLATTPLLPPFMLDASDYRSVQSPLQSPSVAPFEQFSGATTPIDGSMTFHPSHIVSPPLSTKASFSSFHKVNPSRPSRLVPSSEIPPLLIGDPDDEWSMKLGHANFTITPEPYVPLIFDLEACRQLRHDWDLARCNYTKHLVRTGEHYGVTSKTYKYTEEKWATIDAIWRKHNDLTIAHTVDNSADAFATLKHNRLGESPNAMSKIPSLNDPYSEGKFPQLGDEDIVGPMVQAAAQMRRVPSKKTKFFRFLVEKFPVGLGKS